MIELGNNELKDVSERNRGTRGQVDGERTGRVARVADRPLSVGNTCIGGIEIGDGGVADRWICDADLG